MSLEGLRFGRRKALAGTGLGLVGTVLVACTTNGKEATAGSKSAAPPATGGTAPASRAPDVIAKTSEVPLGSGVIVEEIVLTQPSPGVFNGLSAICTHAGCTVNRVEDGTIICPCHGSRYNLDGAVAKGPATRPLQAKAISVEGDSIVLS